MFMKAVLFGGWILAVTLLSAPTGRAWSNDCSVSLQPSEPSPHLVGKRIVWTATPSSCGDAPVYQYRVAILGGQSDERDDRFEHSRKRRHFRVVRDFGLDNTFAWAPMQEGSYDIMVRVKASFDATDSTSTIVSDDVNSLVTGTDAVVTPTLNPLVALYSAPPCEDGTIHIKFRPVANSNDSPWMTTNTLPCVPDLSRNFLVAGMLANTTYEMVQVASEESSPSPLLFTTGTPPATLSIPHFTVRQALGPESDLSQKMIYHNFTGRPAANAVNLLATDLDGRLEWYCDPLQSGLSTVANPGSLEPGGTVIFMGRDRYRTLGFNVLREIDLAGNPLRETNIDAVNAQLKTQGQGIIYGFHHEILRLPNGNIATLGWNLRTVDLNGTPTPYAGTNLMVLDKDFQVVWTWDAFNYLDVHRGPILRDVCTGAPCPILGAVDWQHANAIAWSAADGELLISLRHQAWVLKIDYDRGTGDGHVIWRLGQDGDFAINSTDPNPWFSYQHNPHFLDDTTLLLFDNGNVRCAGVKDCHSRGQVWTLDEEAMTATPVLNADLGNFSDALGSAERLPNGNLVFTSGSQGNPPAQFGQSIEVLPDGTKTYVLEAAAREYRAYRVRGLYRGIRP
jgi:arylsulfate sulfotransferase